MKKIFTALLLVVMAAALPAQAPQKGKPADGAKTASPQASAKAPQQTADAKGAKPAGQKPADPEDDGTVLIDSRGDSEEDERDAQEAEVSPYAVPGGIPSSYGQCKGVLSESGRTILVFESMEDGAISFVQVFFGKGGASWKLVDKIGRSSD